MDIKMLALDLDGTVLHDDKTISDYTLTVFIKCREKGIKIIIATARSEKAADKYIKIIKPDIIISSGGALVRSNDKTIFQCMLSADISDAIIKDLMSRPEFVSVTAEADTGYYVTWENSNSSDYSHAIHYDFNMPLSENVYKITGELLNSSVAKEVAIKYPECCMTPFSDRNWYRFAHRDANKINAIKEAAKAYNIELSSIAAFGDDYNDIDMIRECGVGVAMKNAVDEVKSVADYTCATNNNDGVAKWIEQFLL